MALGSVSHASGSCNTRESVLKRDGVNVVTSSSCAATSGSWYSPYDGATWTSASDVDIDHLVPLSNAWKVIQPPLNSLDCADESLRIVGGIELDHGRS
jgi:hypothetical protein